MCEKSATEPRPIAKKHPNMVRSGIYTIEAVLSKVVPRGSPDELIRVDFDGDLVKMDSLRYHTFLRSGTRCVKCGLEGSLFAKERDGGNTVYHFNLYGVDQEGDEVLLTKDHIIPRSKGGTNAPENLQTMCTICNGRKADSQDEP